MPYVPTWSGRKKKEEKTAKEVTDLVGQWSQGLKADESKCRGVCRDFKNSGIKHIEGHIEALQKGAGTLREIWMTLDTLYENNETRTKIFAFMKESLPKIKEVKDDMETADDLAGF